MAELRRFAPTGPVETDLKVFRLFSIKLTKQPVDARFRRLSVLRCSKRHTHVNRSSGYVSNYIQARSRVGDIQSYEELIAVPQPMIFILVTSCWVVCVFSRELLVNRRFRPSA